MTTDGTYSSLVMELKRLRTLHSIQSLLGWDEQVNLPSGSADLRALQFAEYGELVHREATSPEIGRMLDVLEKKSVFLDQDKRRVVELARRDYDQATKLPREFVKRKSENDSRAFHSWQKARTKGTFADFAPQLKIQIETALEQASLMGRSNDAYSYWIDQFDPGMDLATVESIFAPLEKELVPLARSIADDCAKYKPAKLTGFSKKLQKEFLIEVLTAMGYDFSHGRMDVALHPFCDGDGRDVRITTRYDENNPLDSLFSAMHECGHALYEQGLDTDLAGTALGDSAGMAIHESQSRIWENEIGKSRAFWNYCEPLFRAKFGKELQGISSEDLYRTINYVKPCAVRLDADEVTYNLHIILRFNIEKQLLSGSLKTNDLPEVWREQSKKLLGVMPANDREGCMQDVHWASGSFGYFPSYTLGNLLAAQLWETLHEQKPDIDKSIENGNFAPLLEWLRKNVHSKARRYGTIELSEKICGAKLSHNAHISYIKARYQPSSHA
jgi:carboxypeptidase Taq